MRVQNSLSRAPINSEMENDARHKALKRLLARRKALQDEFDRLVAEPASFGITGSVNATNQKLADLRAELAALDARIAAVLHPRATVAGMSVALPDYRHWPWGIA